MHAMLSQQQQPVHAGSKVRDAVSPAFAMSSHVYMHGCTIKAQQRQSVTCVVFGGYLT